MEKVDYFKQLKHLYQPKAKLVVVVEVPPLNYLMIDGEGDPNTAPAYAAAIEALYSVAYTIKFAVKKGPRAVDFRVMPLEGLWWADDMAAFTQLDKSAWKWTMMIMQPEIVTESIARDALAEVQKKKPELTAPPKLRFETFTEGKCAQILHIGPFSAEGPTIETLHAYIDAHGERVGKHHEIYLSDIRRTDPAKWKTVIRQPMR